MKELQGEIEESVMTGDFNYSPSKELIEEVDVKSIHSSL